jgi:hypothetical protein
MFTLTPQDIARFDSKVRKAGPSDCWEWTGWKNTAHGYGRFDLNGKKVPAHRVAFAIHSGRFFADLLVCHTCDNPGCCNPSHLFLGTPGDNLLDAKIKGRWTPRQKKPKPAPKPRPRGQEHHMAKLKEKDIAQIVICQKAGMTGKQIAAAFGVTRRSIVYVLSGKTWKHISGKRAGKNFPTGE